MKTTGRMSNSELQRLMAKAKALRQDADDSDETDYGLPDYWGPHEALTAIKRALDTYHQALRDRGHGDIAADRFIKKCERIFNQTFETRTS